ncbi:MAG: hypothetical protein KDE47_00075 [Caldilineaceae bacterium]|nr:hypothetical protein [Caldilineaceae bacterium]
MGTLARQHPNTRAEQVILSTSPHVQQSGSGIEQDVKTLGRLWLAGVPIEWRSLYEHEQRLRLHLPTYPFERKRYWFDQVQFKPLHPSTASAMPISNEPSALNTSDKVLGNEVLSNNVQQPSRNGSNGHHISTSDLAMINGAVAAQSVANGNGYVNGEHAPHAVTQIIGQHDPAHSVKADTLHRIVQQQLMLMQQQLQIWRSNRSNS